jgi:sulfatase-like protein
MLYPFLVAAYPVVFFWAHNIDEQVAFADVAPILLLVLLMTAVAWVLARLLLRDAARASLVTATLAFSILTYGRALGLDPPSVTVPRELALLAAYTLLNVAAWVVAVRAPWVDKIAPTMNFVVGVLVGLNLAVVGFHEGRTEGSQDIAQLARPAPVSLPADPPAERPDVYYMIFDRYAGSETLSEQFGYDDGPFLDSLRSRGFCVLDGAVSNYPRTTQSIASSLNMTYLDDVAREVGVDASDKTVLYQMYDDPLIVQTFERLGYHTVNVGSWWTVTAADPGADENVPYWDANEFTFVFSQTTMLPTLMRLLGLSRGDPLQQAIYRNGPRQFEAVAQVADDPRPTFTFAHFLLPHPPYVFTPDGGFQGDRRPLSEPEAYVEQLRYLNPRILAMIDEIVARSDRPPIIVVQADEGPFPVGVPNDDPDYDFLHTDQADLERKQDILNALLLPGVDEDEIPTTLTPVNTFRLILRDYFGADIDLLPDRAYVFRTNSVPFEFHDVTRRLRGTGTDPSEGSAGS